MRPNDLIKVRRGLGLTQSGLADLLGVHWRTIQKWEAGDRKISAPVSLAIELVVQREKEKRGSGSP